VNGVLDWSDTGAVEYRVYLGPAAANGCTTLYRTTRATSVTYSDLQPGIEYSWRVESVSPGCAVASSACVAFKTETGCTTAPPALISPADGATVTSPVTFTWTAVTGATGYDVFTVVGPNVTKVGTTAGTSLSVNVGDGPFAWYVVANGVEGCGSLQSATSSSSVCNVPDKPVASLIAETLTGQTATLSWLPVPGAVRYEVQEATNAAFSGAQTIAATSTSMQITKITNSAQPFFYRVRAFNDCNPQGSPYSEPVRVVFTIPPPATDPHPSVNVPAGSTTPFTLQVFVPAVQAPNPTFTATVDKPWMSVSPASGPLPPGGITLTITIDPTGLPNGTFTGTVIVIINDGLASRYGLATHGSTTAKTPVSVSLVTPVTPMPTPPAPDGSVIIPSAGHLDGISSTWRSDIRVANPGATALQYQLTFKPGDLSKPVQQTTINVAGGATTALDDVVRNWYGIGSLGEASNGVLQIRSLATTGAPAVVSSRTYNSTANGSLGQFVPAIPFASFVGRAVGQQARAILSLQQVAQSSAFRTNLGIVESTGKDAQILLSIFDGAGTKLRDVPLTLFGNQQAQLNGFMAQQGLTLTDGRIEVSVTGGDGLVTAYASVVDNATSDPLLVSPVQLGKTTSQSYVLPGVADLAGAGANWRTDMRILNASTATQNATLTFYPQNNSGAPLTSAITIKPGETLALDSVLASQFNAHDTGGAVHVTTANASSMVVTGRTYNQTSNGTFGQFVPAVTPQEAVSLGEQPLQILQLEESVRFRTNVGLAEVTGKPARVEVSVALPDSLATPFVQIDLAPNEFRQFALLRELGLDGAYNARVSVRVLSGEGSVTAYGSVVDMVTQDPTYVPGQ
jgi:hypothetical protein